MGEFLDKLQGYADYIDAELEKLLPPRDNYQKVIYDAMRYSLLGGGKRIRPMLVLEFCRISGGNDDPAFGNSLIAKGFAL